MSKTLLVRLAIALSAFAPLPAASADDDGKNLFAPVASILERRCLSCHDDLEKRGGLSLASQASAARGGESGPLVARSQDGRPARPEDSLLMTMLAGREPAMPKTGPPLDADQLEAIRRWIAAGARWPADAKLQDRPAADADWWSLRPAARPAPPADASSWSRNPIDQFVLAKLREKGLAPSPEADRRTLVRRLAFDLTGLPPSSEMVAEFLADAAPQAYERLVDRLLDSQHYGERWARHWLDVVHFGETHGYDKDKLRPNAWPYRDYVVRSLNADKPYARFVQEQIAGDVLFPGTTDGHEALGFIAAGPWDFIGHAEVPETKIDGKVARHLDRDDMVATTIGTFCSLTVQCAQCHHHKFDPISQEDYYRLQAVFAALDRADKKYFADADLSRRHAELERRQRTQGERKKSLEARIAAAAGGALQELDRQIQVQTRKQKLSQAASSGRRPEFGYHSQVAPGPDVVKWVQVDLGERRAVERIIYAGCYDDFNDIGAGFGFPVRFKIELSDDPQFVADVATIVDATAADFPNPGVVPQTAAVGGRRGRYVRFTAVRLAPRRNDYILALAELQVFDASGKNLAAGAAVTALDSIEAPVRWRRSNLVDDIYAGQTAPSETSPSSNAAATPTLADLQAERRKLLERSTDDAQRRELAALAQELEQIAAELKSFPAPQVVYAGVVHHGTGTFSGTGPRGGKPRDILLLRRGDVTRPDVERGPLPPGAIRAIAGPAATFALPPEHAEGERRAELARWISDPRHPLTWRSIVNRVWQYHFGRGLVDTPNDFGRMGSPPTHPELLDWLAVEFRDGGQSLKRLHRLMVTSATYRQVSHSPTATKAVAIDAQNTLYWRMNRRKLEAEALRDATLLVAGKLDTRMGGPSFQDFVVEQPAHSPHYEYGKHDPEDPKTHRRSIYRFLVRSQPQPFMTTLDCADPSMRVDKRNESVSALQALALLNNGFMVSMSRHFADRLLALPLDDAARLDRAFRSAIGRPPRDDEQAAFAPFVARHGWPNACRVLLNLNEFAFVD